MNILDGICSKIKHNDFEFSRHATDRMILRHISIEEIREAIVTGEVIEDYPNDKYGPSCLILGYTNLGKPLHLQCSYPSRPLVKIITTYEPERSEWIDDRIRK